MAVYFVQSGSRATAYYRCELPARALSRIGVRSVGMPGVPVDKLTGLPPHLDEFVVWVFQIPHNPALVNLAVALRQAGKTVVVEFDDDYLHLPPDNKQVLADKLWPQHVKVRQDMARLAHVVTVSTPELILTYKYLNPNVLALPNCIDFDDFPKPRREGKRLTVGWAGAPGCHDGNIAPLLSTLAELTRLYRHVDIAIGGDRAIYDRLKCPVERKRFVEACDVRDFPRMLVEFDIAVKPLADNRFNQGKSELAGLQLGALKIPFLASDMAPYRRFAKLAGSRDFLIEKPKQWLPRLKQLVENKNERKHLGRLAYEAARTRQIDNHIGKWIDAYYQATENAAS